MNKICPLFFGEEVHIKFTVQRNQVRLETNPISKETHSKATRGRLGARPVANSPTVTYFL